MKFPEVSLDQVIKVHYGKALKQEERFENGNIPVFGSNGIVGFHNQTIVDQPTIIIGRKGSVGAITFAPIGGWPIDTAFFIEIINSDILDLRFLYYGLIWVDLAQHTITTSIPGINRNDIYKSKIPLPPLEEQRRIAAILDRADGLRAARRAALAQLDALTQATFVAMFGDPVTNPLGWETINLIDIADIGSGITKSQARIKGKQTVNLPYMRVANVQDGYILTDQENMKFIDVLPEDVEKYLLKYNDILLTEGGDSDKLGRGAVWKEQINPCIHQNHIFRVRLINKQFTPNYISNLISSGYGKLYFLRSAKQTTGIASINKSQLSSFPVLIADIQRQKQFDRLTKNIESIQEKYQQSLAQLDDLFHALQQRAFRGELSD